MSASRFRAMGIRRFTGGLGAAKLIGAKTGPDEGRSPGNAAGSALIKCQYFTDVPNFSHVLRGRQRERGIKTKMRVKLAAKMLIIAWTLMKKKEPFNPDYLHIE